MLFLWLRIMETWSQYNNSIGILFDPCDFDFVARQTDLVFNEIVARWSMSKLPGSDVEERAVPRTFTSVEFTKS